MLFPGAIRWLACSTAALALLVPAAAAAASPPLDLPIPAESPYAPAGRSPSSGVSESQRHIADNDRGFSHALRLSDLQSVSADGIDYYTFALEPEGSGRNHDGALDVLHLYIADRGDISSLGELAMEGDLVLDLLLPGSGVWIAGTASGRGRAEDGRPYLVPARALKGIDPDRYLYLYSRFAATSGTSNSTAQGSDEGDDCARPRKHGGRPDVAEPATPLLLATGLLAAALARRRLHR